MTSPRFLLDRAGFPMIHSEALGRFVHWLPVTKIQLEAFLCAAPPPGFDADWYAARLEPNPRVAPRDVCATNYWAALATGLKPSEAEAYAAWSHPDDRLPTSDEWFAVYREARERPALDPLVFERLGLSPRARVLTARVDAAMRAAAPYTLADQMLLREGVWEWVRCRGRGTSWGAFGRPNMKFHGHLYNLDAGRPKLSTDPETHRSPAQGFRLVRGR